MVHVVLLEPEIAGNVGSIARTCLAAGARLHLVRPLGFRLTDAQLRRAGVDYWNEAEVSVHASFSSFAETFRETFVRDRAFAITTKGQHFYTEVAFEAEDVLLFGPESRGLPEAVRRLAQPLRIPMRPEVRSLNLAVSVGVVVYEAWRQQGFLSGGERE